LPSSIVLIASGSDLLFIRLLQTKTKTGQKKAGFFVSKILSCARAEREKMRDYKRGNGEINHDEKK